MPDTTLRPCAPLEHWEPIPGYEGLYDISNQGRVWSRGRRHWMRNAHARFVRHTQPRLMKPYQDGKHQKISLVKHGKQRRFTIMSLMKKAFIHAA